MSGIEAAGLTTLRPFSFAQSERRNDGEDKVRGRAVFTADVARPGTLWAAFVESPHAYARIGAIDVHAAAAIDGVRAILLAEDIGAARFGRRLCDWPVLADGVVRFVGDRVAAVAAETREAAEAAARAIEVTYEPLSPLLDARAATALDAPLLHPDWDAYHVFPDEHGRRPQRTLRNSYGSMVIEIGVADRETIFAGAAHVFEHTYETPRQLAGFVEPRAALVWIADDGVVHVHSTNKSPFALRRQIAHAARVPEDRIVVEPTLLGGDFGGKGATMDEIPCYFLARATGRPVRYVATYMEELRRGPSRHRTSLRLRTAVDRDGSLLAHESTVLYDGGAYAATKPIPTLLPGNAYGSIPYRVPNARIEIAGVYTNTLPAAHVRGPGEIQTFTAWELHVDAIARTLGIDPLVYRLQNVVRDGDAIVTGEPIVRPMAATVLETLRDALPPLPPGRGRGVSLVCAHTGSANSAVKLIARADGTFEAILAMPEQGAGVGTMAARVIAATLHVDPAIIRVRRGTTDEVGPDPGPGHSRGTHIVGRAALDAAQQIGAHRAAGGVLPHAVVGRFRSDHGEQVPGDLTFGACAIDVEVDRDTGAVAVRDALFVADVGEIINPIAHEAQLEGGFVMGLGAALMEDAPVDEDGRSTAYGLADYKLPTIADVPPLRLKLVRAPDGDGPYGARMIGELSNVGIAAAVINAVADATGARLSTYPVRAEAVFDALVAARRH